MNNDNPIVASDMASKNIFTASDFLTDYRPGKGWNGNFLIMLTGSLFSPFSCLMHLNFSVVKC